MTRYERKIYSFGIVIAAILIIAIVAVLTDGCGTKIEAYAAPVCAVEDFTEESSETSETGLFDEDSAMPCVDPEGFAAWYEEYQHASITSNTLEALEPEIPIYHFNVGPNEHQIEPDLQRLLYHYLEEAGIEYWYEGALAQMYQESHGIWWAENPNGLDKGIYQYRITYWNWNDGDIFDVDAQMRRYTSEMSARFNSGLSADEAISRHKTSDYVTTIDWTYVGHVKQWLPLMEAIR